MNLVAKARSRVRKTAHGWWVAAAGSANMAIVSTPTHQGASAIFAAIEEEFGWSRALITGVASFGRFGGSLLGPVEGWLTDRFGPARMVLVGLVTAGIGFILFSRINAPIHYYATYLLLSIGVSLGSFMPSMTAVNAWLPHRRATGMAIVLAGSSIGALLVAVMAAAITAFGWRTTVLFIGVVMILVAPLLARVLAKRAPEPARPIATPRARARPQAEFTARQAVRTRAFWAMAIGHFLANLSVGTISAHIVLHLKDVGLSYGAASGMIGIIGGIAFCAQLTGGFFGDRINKRLAISVLLLLQACAVAMLAFVDSYATAVLFAVMWGIGFGGRPPMLHALRGEYFGRQAFGTITGLSGLIMSGGMMGAPVIVGWVFDVYGTYRWAFLILAATCVGASAVMLLATRPSPPSPSPQLPSPSEGG